MESLEFGGEFFGTKHSQRMNMLTLAWMARKGRGAVDHTYSSQHNNTASPPTDQNAGVGLARPWLRLALTTL